MKTLGVAVVVAILASTGCGERVVFNEDGVDLLVVDARLIVDQPMPGIWLTRSLPPQEPITPASAGERNAEVWIVDQDGVRYDFDDTIRLDGEFLIPPGRYLPVDATTMIQPDTRYDLFVRAESGEELTATTLTPPRLSVREWVALNFDLQVIGELETFQSVGDSVYEVASNQLEWGASLLEARFERDARVVAYQVALFSLDPESDFAIEPDFFEEEDFEDLDREGSSPMFLAPDGKVRLPWFAVFFEGRYLVKVFATDRNWDAIVRTTPSLSDNGGFGGNAGDGFDRPEFYVNGGIGLFGSASVDSVGFFVFDED